MVTVYNALDGPNWEDSENWLSDAPLGEWYGVKTDDNGRVIWLQLGGYQSGLSGEIPPEMGGLGALTVLTLSEDGLSGEIPPELGNLSNLENLSIAGNGLTGEIPPELGNLASLNGLGLSGEGLSGGIPPVLN